ncbi:hypothetical protein AWB93_12430 [Mycobacterium bohemicum]|jgi:hypothetical protein|uniref:Uncharacterized protein n=2 Tax=Mycobacterium bohemicum TaxID=56425 RepID=A0A1X1R4G9_MYCBE|nr:hypothetical protein [Mycobacterium bohemicum]ORU99221.1 hypothetical protein AWB93_12430 [Mycobacterium bohemicum]
MAMVKSLLDGLNHQQHMRDGNREPSMTELTVTGAHIQHDLAVIVNAPKIFGVDSPVGSGGNRVRGVFRGT